MHNLKLTQQIGQWQNSINRMENLIDELEIELQKIENDYYRKKGRERIDLLIDNFNNQIDLIEMVFGVLNTDYVPKYKVQDMEQMLKKAKLYINRTGGDWSNLHWMKLSDFH